MPTVALGDQLIGLVLEGDDFLELGRGCATDLGLLSEQIDPAAAGCSATSPRGCPTSP